MATIIDSNGTPTSESSALSVIGVTLDIRQNRMVSVLLKQYNKQSQQIKFTVTDNGEKIELKEIEHTVLFKMMTPDGRRVSSYCAINENDHTAVLTVAKNYCSYPGKGTAELEVMDALEESQVGTMNLDVVIENSAYPDEMINGSSTYQGLDEKINAVREACNSAITAKEETETIRDECDGIRNTCNDLKEEAQQYKNEAMSYANGESGTRYGEETDNAKYFYELAVGTKTTIENLLEEERVNAENIANYTAQAKESEDNAESFANNASGFASNAANSASEAKTSETNATISASNASSSASEAAESATQAQTALGQLTNIIDAFYPVGSIYMSVVNTDPSTLFGGTWESWGAGRVPVGVGIGTDENGVQRGFNTVESRGGEYTHSLNINEIPEHTHNYSDGSIYVGEPPESCITTDGCLNGGDGHLLPQSTSETVTDNPEVLQTTKTGKSEPHNNIQPYITCYMWKRTA